MQGTLVNYFLFSAVQINEFWSAFHRYQNLNSASFEDLDELETYSELTQSTLIYSFMELMKIDNNNQDLLFAASHIGVAYGIVLSLRNFKHHVSKVRSDKFRVFKCTDGAKF